MGLRRRKVLSLSVNALGVRHPTVASLGSTWRYHRNAWRAWWRGSIWNRLLVLAILVYGTAFSILACLRILALSAFALDLGLYNQAMYTTVAYGRFFYVSGLPPSGGESFFGGHFSPILFLFLLPYALVPSPFTLVVLQSWVIALGAAPIYRLAQRFLKSDLLAFAFALVFLLDPAVQGVNWFDFHVEACLLLTLPAMLYFYERRNWKWFVFFAVLSLATIEMAAVLVAVVAVVALASEAWHWRSAGQVLDRRGLSVVGSIAILSAVWLYGAGAIVQAINSQASYFSAGAATWSILEAPTALAVPIQVILHPNLAIEALTYDGISKVWYLIVLFAPVQFLTFRSPRATLACVPWLVVSLFSNFPGLYLVGNHYPAYILPFIFYGAIVGLAQPWSPPSSLRRLVHWPRPSSRHSLIDRGYARTLLGLTLVLLVVVSPLGPWAIGSDNTGRAPLIGSHERAVLQLYGLVPSNASVLTQNNLYPLLSSRLNVHFVPSNVEFVAGTSFNATMNLWTSTMDYILVDCVSSFTEAAVVLTWPNVSASYSLVAAADGALLLERGTHPLVFYRPLVLSYDYSSVVLVNGSVVADSSTTSGFALVHPNTTTSHFWYGPFPALPPGSYTATYRLKIDRLAAGPIIGLPVILHPVDLLAQVVHYSPSGEQVFFSLDQIPAQVFVNVTQVQGSASPAPGRYFTVSTNFSVQTLGAYEFPGLGASGGVTIWFDNLTIVQRTPLIAATMPVSWSSS